MIGLVLLLLSSAPDTLAIALEKMDAPSVEIFMADLQTERKPQIYKGRILAHSKNLPDTWPAAYERLLYRFGDLLLIRAPEASLSVWDKLITHPNQYETLALEKKIDALFELGRHKDLLVFYDTHKDKIRKCSCAARWLTDVKVMYSLDIGGRRAEARAMAENVVAHGTHGTAVEDAKSFLKSSSDTPRD